MTFDYTVLILATASLIQANSLREAYKQLLSNPTAESICSVASFSYPPQRGLVIRDGNLVLHHWKLHCTIWVWRDLSWLWTILYGIRTNAFVRDKKLYTQEYLFLILLMKLNRRILTTRQIGKLQKIVWTTNKRMNEHESIIYRSWFQWNEACRKSDEVCQERHRINDRCYTLLRKKSYGWSEKMVRRKIRSDQDIDENYDVVFITDETKRHTTII